MKEAVAIAVSLITALGGWEALKYFLNRKSNKRIADANAFEVERKAIIEDYKRVQEELDKLQKKVDELYKRVHQLESERLDLIHENNRLRLELKEAEKRVCLQPDDRCLQRLNPDDKCRLRKILRGEYLKDNPDAIITEEDMMREPEESGKKLYVPADTDKYFTKID